MIKLEAQELRGVPVIKLDFAPQSEQFTGLGRALTAFVEHAQENFSSFDKGEITFGWQEKQEQEEVVVEIKKPRAEYKDVSLPTTPVLQEEEKKIVQTIVEKVEAPAEEPAVQQAVKNKKKKVETKPASI